MKALQANRLLVIVAVSAVLGMCSQAVVGGTLRIIHSFDLPGSAVGGYDISWDGQYIWASYYDKDNFSGIHTLDPVDGSVVWPFEAGVILQYGMRMGVAWDGTNVWTSRPDAREGRWDYGTPPDVVPDYVERHSMIDFSVTRQLLAPRSPDAVTTGAAWDGTSLWLSDAKHREISQIDPGDGTVLTSFPSPGTEPLGLAWDGTWLWSVDGASRTIYQIDTSGNVIETWVSPVERPWGIAFDGEHLWILDNETDRIVEVVPEPWALVLLVVGFPIVVWWARRGRGRSAERGKESA